MGRERLLPPEAEADIRKRSHAGEAHYLIAREYKVHPSTITRIMRRDVKRATRYTTMEIAYKASEKLLKAVEGIQPEDGDKFSEPDRKFLTEAFKASADRSGMSPQAVAIQLNQNIGVSVKVQPLLAASEAEDLKKLLSGGQE